MSRKTPSSPVKQVDDAQFNRISRKIERESFRATPDHKHERYPRVGNRTRYRDNFDTIFGKHKIRKPGKTVYRYNSKDAETEDTRRKKFREGMQKLDIPDTPKLGYHKSFG